MMVALEDLVPEDHIYYRFAKLWGFKGVKKNPKKGGKG